jgi:hypothetical protein
MKLPLCAAAFVFLGVCSSVLADGVSWTNGTVLALAKKANEFVPPKVHDRIIRVHSEKSTDGLVPDVWYIDYFDTTVPFKRTEVKFVRGEKTDFSHPAHMTDWFNGSKALQWRKVRIDSDRALAIAMGAPILQNLKLEASQFWLEQTATGSIWRVRLWAAFPGGIYDFDISSATGKIVATKTHHQSHP